MKSHYYFHGDNAKAEAEAFAAERSESHPRFFKQPGRIVVVLER